MATRLSSETLYRVLAILLVVIAAILVSGHGVEGSGHAMLGGTAQAIVGVIAGFVIGIVASLMGVAGGELLIPTLILLFGADVKLAGSLSLAVSLRPCWSASHGTVGTAPSLCWRAIDGLWS